MSAWQSYIKVNGSFYKEVMCSEPSFNQLNLVTMGMTLWKEGLREGGQYKKKQSRLES